MLTPIGQRLLHAQYPVADKTDQIGDFAGMGDDLSFFNTAQLTYFIEFFAQILWQLRQICDRAENTDARICTNNSHTPSQPGRAIARSRRISLTLNGRKELDWRAKHTPASLHS
ncbi:MAG: hypothetical protein WAO88_09105 [Roseicyclus sp.]|uniref:hypothetical protein n=1 Tax=Roseicyclus sp. TaxID=1914329 RepID=UPI003BB1B502